MLGSCIGSLGCYRNVVQILSRAKKPLSDNPVYQDVALLPCLLYVRGAPLADTCACQSSALNGLANEDQGMSDLILEAWVCGLVEIAKLRGTPKAHDSWTPGKQLKLLIAGYNGARNTGEEVRVEEIVRQFREVLGADNLQLSVLTLNPDFSREYYGDAAQVHLPFIFPPFLYRLVPRYDGVVSSCGAMFMSKFSNVPSIMMIEALGIASAQGKLSVAYGGEAGAMDPMLASMCRRYCGRTSMIIRNEESRSALQKL
jgi:hypothetical protein